MAVSMEMVCMAKFWPRNSQSERSDLPQLTILPYNKTSYLVLGICESSWMGKEG